MEKLQACVSRLLTWLRRLPGWFQVHLSRLTRVRGIRQRWLMNSVSFLVMVLAVVVIVFGLIVKNYYDSSILSDMESKARTAVNYFSSTSSNYNSADGDYLSAAQDYVSSFQDGTRLELQYLDPEGTVIYSSNGLTISGSVPGTPRPSPPGGASPPRPGSASPPSPRPCCITASWWASCATSRPCAWSIARSSS